jgi:flagellar FliL protein
MNKTIKLMGTLILIGIVASSMTYMLKEVSFDHSTSLPQKRVSKEPGYHTTPIIDWQDRTMVRLGDFTTNTVSGENNRHRFLKTKISVRTSSEATSDEIKRHHVIIRDAVIRTLGSRTFEQISSDKGKLELKATIGDDLNTILKEGEVNEVYFTEFIMQ